MNEKLHAYCIVCEEWKPTGISICGQFICEECERDIVSTDVSEERYQHYVECMKKIWLAAIS